MMYTADTLRACNCILDGDECEKCGATSWLCADEVLTHSDAWKKQLASEHERAERLAKAYLDELGRHSASVAERDEARQVAMRRTRPCRPRCAGWWRSDMRDGTKYGNVPTNVGGKVFASKLEARRYRELLLLERGGMIRELETQPVFDLVVNGEKICRYIADFQYYDTERNAQVVEDSKGVRTETYKLKKRLMKACLGIEVEEV